MSATFDVTIVGGSYAGLSAAMALGRAVRNVLIIDSGDPCNKQTPHSHNFLTQDGQTPAQIASKAKQQVLQYPTISWHQGLVADVVSTPSGFEISTAAGEKFKAKKILFATGIKDQLLPVKGFAEAWGISVLHCPYCHGYEIKGEVTGIIANGDMGFEFSRLISNWTKKLTLFTNGPSTLTAEQAAKIRSHNITIVESPISAFEQEKGYLRHIVLEDGTQHPLTAVYAKLPFIQHCDIPKQLGCAITEQGFIEITEFQQTTVHGVYAAGDNTTMLRSVSAAVAAGTKAGAMINRELIEEEF
ncbi:NAD(P)/FAD-dependent oxidoreductase [Chitinophaga sp. SYP-B3965]|uniref:NAD(P)/FAD-dependent oxidoreductase n=1 Tax=Chitinophaga sp. SYP-B3965 TaxID=2663120 RepID=UPI001299D815|nr:NAD(P)/FAD-dependent oxidoreductase [Chitinophaga sp. SYP-B3965]MRG44140.1 NAD(P)/FAD-dependent oxidoreductase [Chitinophaga sp. SYP-B3965]